MAQATHKSFGSLTEAQFKTHADAVVGSHPTASQRKQVLAYLDQVLASDSAAIATDTKAAFARRSLHKKQKAVVDGLHETHTFDPAKIPTVFTQQSPSDAQIAALLANDDVDVSIGARTLTTNLAFTGDRVTLTGTGASGKAVDGSIACTCVFQGQVQLGADDVVIKGIRFVCGLAPSIIFTAPCRNLTLEDCIFENTSTYRLANQGGSVFIFGGEHDDFFSGNLTLRNCQVGVPGASFGSWMLADLTTGSYQPSVTKLDHVVIVDNKFEDVAGSFSIRGRPDTPIDSCTITGNLVVYQPSGNFEQHSLFWASFEVNNCLKVICTGNTVTGASKTAGGTRHFLQTWSRSGHAWYLNFGSNTLAEFNIALAMPCSATFYAPSILSDGHAIGSATGEITGTELGLSSVYPWLTGSYAPVNAATIPAIPSSFADSLPTFHG